MEICRVIRFSAKLSNLMKQFVEQHFLVELIALKIQIKFVSVLKLKVYVWNILNFLLNEIHVISKRL